MDTAEQKGGKRLEARPHIKVNQKGRAPDFIAYYAEVTETHNGKGEGLDFDQVKKNE